MVLKITFAAYLLSMNYCYRLLFIIGIIFSFGVNRVNAQYNLVITNLNSKSEIVLHKNESFYFGLHNTREKFKGKLEHVNANSIVIDGKTYNPSEIQWIDFKGNSLKKNNIKIAQVLSYFGGGLLGFSIYEYTEVKDKNTAIIAGAAGATLLTGALLFWVLPKQPLYDFTTKHLLEIVPEQETK